MNPDDLTTTVQRLRERALEIRRDRNRLTRHFPATPASATRSLGDAAQALDDAATDLLNAYGQDMPQEAF
jgi:hypothetical protein